MIVIARLRPILDGRLHEGTDIRQVAKFVWTPYGSRTAVVVVSATDEVPDHLDRRVEQAITAAATADCPITAFSDHFAPALTALGLIGSIDWDRWADDENIRINVSPLDRG